MYAGCYGLVREIGALKDTVRPFADKGWAKLLFLAADTEEERLIWAEELLLAIKERRWERIDQNEIPDYSWTGVARDFLYEANILSGLDILKEATRGVATI